MNDERTNDQSNPGTNQPTGLPPGAVPVDEPVDPLANRDATPATAAAIANGRRITSSLIDLDSIKPVADQLLVHLDVGVQVTEAGIYLPPSAQEIRQTGVVLAVSPDYSQADGVPVGPGTHVLVDRSAGYGLGFYNNSPVNIYRAKDVFAVLEE